MSDDTGETIGSTASTHGLRPATWAVTAGRPPHDPDQPLNTPLTLAATYVAGGDLEYGRYGNPTWTAFEDTLGGLEGGHCLAFASGLGAVAAILDLVAPGGKVVVPRHSYLGTLAQLTHLAERGRVTVDAVDATDAAAFASACDGAAMVWFESPTNPALEVVDIRSIADAAHAAGAIVVADNTFATPLRQRPLEHGADIVVHSATKWIAGHSDVVLGATVAADDALHAELRSRRSLHGATPAAMDVFLALRGIRTLAVRLDRAEQNATELAARLADHPSVTEVRYPGFGGIISIVLAAGDSADAFVAGTRLWVNATSLGGVESTLERRRRWPGEAPTIPEGLIRLSVGIEDVEDLHADLAQALDAAASSAADGEAAQADAERIAGPAMGLGGE